jgi:hypothetical protein
LKVGGSLRLIAANLTSGRFEDERKREMLGDLLEMITGIIRSRTLREHAVLSVRLSIMDVRDSVKSSHEALQMRDYAGAATRLHRAAATIDSWTDSGDDPGPQNGRTASDPIVLRERPAA